MSEALDTSHRICPDCGGTLVGVHMLARGNSGLSLGSTDALVRYYVSAESERVQAGDSVIPAGVVRAMLCGKCHRMFLFGVPNLLETPKRFETTPSVSRNDDEPLRLVRDSGDGVKYLHLEQDGAITIVRVVTDRMNPIDDLVQRSISKEFAEVVEQCHPRTLLDLRELLPVYHSSAFVTNLIKFKRRFLEMHDLPEGRRGDDGDQAGARPAQPSVRQLSFPVFPNRSAAVAALVAMPDGRAEMALCGVSQALHDVLKVTRMLRKSES